jgi:hypothetical protein
LASAFVSSCRVIVVAGKPLAFGPGNDARLPRLLAA